MKAAKKRYHYKVKNPEFWQVLKQRPEDTVYLWWDKDKLAMKIKLNSAYGKFGKKEFNGNM
jgi:DNA polymerase elongation subunit (family B)